MIKPYDFIEISRLLGFVEKPARYVGSELNVIYKENPKLRVGMSYPDLYEVGMANQGIKILYDIINNNSAASCERVFAVAPDFEKILRENKYPLYTLETKIPLNKLDLLCFNLAHELLYSNVLQILDLGGIPVLRKERGDFDPLIIGGGCAAANPRTMENFIDGFYIGDGEEGILDIVKSLVELSHSTVSRTEKLEALQKIEGLYIPEYTKNKVKKRIYRGFELSYPAKPLVPNIRISQDRAILNVARGCFNQCRFCQAGFNELPARIFDKNILADYAFTVINNTGYDELSLLSLSITDYPYLPELLNTLMPKLYEQGVSLSLPSLRVDKNTIDIISAVSPVRKTSLTFAVEAGNSELRNISNKRLVADELYDIIKKFTREGWRTVKLYFMIGLPGFREYDEAEGIREVLGNITKNLARNIEINVTISPFIPKPHTPFEREEQADSEYCRGIIDKIRRNVSRNVTIKNHNINSSKLEGIFARGNVNVGDVIYDAYLHGARLDSWDEFFNMEIWVKSFSKIFPEWNSILNKIPEDIEMPWSIIDYSHSELINLHKKMAKEAKALPPIKNLWKHNIDRTLLNNAIAEFHKKYNTVQNLRLQFSKKGDVRFISHLDLLEVVRRGIRMANIPIAYSQGFNKHEKITAGYPLAIGIESDSELIDIQLYEEISPDEVYHKLQGKFPDGIEIKRVSIPEEKSVLMKTINAIEYNLIINDVHQYKLVKDALSSKTNIIKPTKNGDLALLFDEVIVDYKINCFDYENAAGDMIIYTRIGSDRCARIDQILSSWLPELWQKNILIAKLNNYQVINGNLRMIN